MSEPPEKLTPEQTQHYRTRLKQLAREIDNAVEQYWTFVETYKQEIQQCPQKQNKPE